MADEQDFEVVDRRRVNAEEIPKEEAASGDEPTAEPAEEAEASWAEPGAGGGVGELPPIAARDLLVIYVNQLQELAWSRMGLTPNPVSGTIDRDLADARLAIDCTADIIGRLDPFLDATTRREMQTLLANLRMNFVQQSGKT